MPGSAEGANCSGNCGACHTADSCPVTPAMRELGEHELLAMWFIVAAALVCHKAGSGDVPSNTGKKSTSLFTDKTNADKEPTAADRAGTTWTRLQEQAG